MGGSKPTILYVEDDKFSREVLAHIITRVMGFPDLIVFEDSSDFMERVQALPRVPDIFFLDVQVNPIDGHKMLALLRADERYKNSRIIAVTASVMADEVKVLQDAGFDGLIGKPIMKKVFPDLLSRILKGEKVWYVS